jgi:chromosome segregation ATPase
MTTIEELDIRVTALETARDSRLDAIAAISADTRTRVENIERIMVTRVEFHGLSERVDALAVVSKDTREAVRRLEKSVAGHDARFDAVDERFDAVDKRFDAVDKRFDAVDKRFDRIETDMAELKGAVGQVKTGMARVLELLEARV